MSDAVFGWTELLAAPLGAEPAPEASLATLLCLASLPEERAPAAQFRPTASEP